MPASRFLKYTGRNWPNPVCSFYLPVSTSRDVTVQRQIHLKTTASQRRVYLYHKMTPPPNFGYFWIIFEGWSQILPSTKLFHMDLNKGVPPWRRKSWRKRYSHTVRMQNQAKLAAGANRGHESREYPTPEELRGGQRSWAFMYVVARDPSFLTLPSPLISSVFTTNVGFNSFLVTAIGQALICNQFEWADYKKKSWFLTLHSKPK